MVVVVAGIPGQAVGEGPAVSFTKHVKPILDARCLNCHKGDDPSGALDLSTKAGIKKGGKSGKLYVAKKGKQSLLVRSLRGEGMQRMPKRATPLTETQIQLIQRWIDEGARF